ncbi:lactonase family protein [Rhodotorula paludigena]|uniref:lactonase family protein n=1 Tax=Rhodotorula paludigena TaxID=86838 RepID=UPI0031729BEF
MAAVCATPPASALLATTADSLSPRLHYLLSGTFNTLFLYLLAFSPYAANGPTLTVHRKYRAEGPHQFIALSEDRKRAFATTWAQPPTLSSWEVLGNGRDGIRKVNTVPISATGSYLAVSPASLGFAPPRVYQAGGPVAQTFAVDSSTGGFGEQLQEVIYLDGGEEELRDPRTDKTRVALRYGSHAVDIDPVFQRAYVPHVGRDSLFVYSFNPDGTLHHLNEIPSHGNRGHEGPRHSIPCPDGKKLYVITEHTSYLDVYDVLASTPYLEHSQRLSVIPPHQHSTRPLYRGDTLRLSSDRRRLYVTTRGKTANERGWVAVFALAADGSVREATDGEEEEEGYGAVSRFETRNSGGKANAIEVFPFWPTTSSSSTAAAAAAADVAGARPGPEGRDWIVLTDDEAGFVSVLEWRDAWGELREVASVQLGVDAPVEGEGAGEVSDEEKGTGASHAVWLS